MSAVLMQVHCWDVGAVLAAGAEGRPAPAPQVLGSWDAPAKALAWDATGRYLATSNGADCAVW